MFLKGFLVLSCLVLYTTSRPTKTWKPCRNGPEMIAIIDKIECSDSKLPWINFTVKDKINDTYQDKFCQVSEALKMSNCSDPNMPELRRVSRQLQGNATCILKKYSNHSIDLKDIRNYLESVYVHCKRK